MPAKKTKRNFLKEFIKERRVVGAIHPSTKALGEKMLENIDFASCNIIVELGPGTGVFTDLIMERMNKDAKLLVFELNDNFYESLAARIDHPQVQIIHDSAEFVDKYLTEDEKKNVDAVVSSLPLTVFPEKLRQTVLDEAYDCLKDGGLYTQFQYSLHAKKLLESRYKDVSIKFTLKNFPPAFVYTCRKA
ncbi:MAG: methyltransferase domain-containing protein [Crocinitomicaceae bacterium]|nr:methyltransferase domain-containing protein [Crocinitomicaceae bacterium]